METNKLITGIVAAAIAVIVLAGVLMPALANATDTEDTFTNEGFYRMKLIETGDVWTYDSTNGWFYGDELQSTVKNGWNAILGDNWCIRNNGQCRGPYISGNSTGLTATAGEVNIVFVATAAGGTMEYPISGYGIYTEGNYLMTDPDKKVKLNGDSVIYATGISNIDDVQVTIHIEATIDDGVNIVVMDNRNISSVSNAVISNEKINYVSVEGYKDLYEVTSITADITFDNTVSEVTTTHTGSITYNSYVVPYEVTAEKAVHLSDAMNVILNVIPLLIIVSVLLGVVAVFILRRE